MVYDHKARRFILDGDNKRLDVQNRQGEYDTITIGKDGIVMTGKYRKRAVFTSSITVGMKSKMVTKVLDKLNELGKDKYKVDDITVLEVRGALWGLLEWKKLSIAVKSIAGVYNSSTNFENDLDKDIRILNAIFVGGRA